MIMVGVKAKIAIDNLKSLTFFIINLQEAIAKGDMKKAKEALKIGTNILLYTACAEGSESLTEKLLSIGADASFVNKSKSSRAPLHAAAAGGYCSIVKQLLDNGAGLNVEDKHGNTLLHTVIYRGHSTLARDLFTNKVTFNA
jgi:hypothetical protein